MGCEGSGQSASRLHAVTTFISKKWKVGDVLASNEWYDNRVIRGVIGNTKKMLQLQHFGNSVNRVKTLPADVHRIGG